MKRWAVVGLLCGWVLWHGMGMPPSVLHFSWTISDAYESRRECVAEAGERVKSFQQKPVARGRHVTRGGLMFTYLDDEKNPSLLERLQCLPAGTDPRPRYKE